MTETEFLACLRARHDPREYALFPQVRAATGFGCRTADALAVSLWPSRGIDAHGFEFKDSRTDWLKELKSSEKSDQVGRHCSFWWLVVSDRTIFSADELPAAWGALHAADGTCKVLKKAPRREPEPVTWPFVAAVLRAAVEHVSKASEVQRLVREAARTARDGEYKRGKASEEARVKAIAAERDQLQKLIHEFEESAGVTLSTWKADHNARVGNLVRLVLGGGYATQQDQFERLARTHREAADLADAAAKELGALAAPGEPRMSPPDDFRPALVEGP